MGGVSGKKNRAIAKAVGNNCGSFPSADAEHRYRQVRNANGLPDQRLATLRREIPGLVTIFAQAMNQEAPTVCAIDSQECTAQLWLFDKVERRRTMFGPLPKVGIEQ